MRSIREKCIRRDLPDPHGSIKYLEARTTARIELLPKLACLWSTEVSTTAHAPRGKSVLHVLKRIKYF